MNKIPIFITTFFLIFPWLLQAQTLPPAIINHGDQGHKQIALTFDADMTNNMLAKLKKGTEKSLYNEEIVKILRQEKVSATFFLTALWAKQYPDATKDLANDSLFAIGNHSYRHQGFTTNCYGLEAIKEETKAADFVESQTTLEKLTGKKPGLFRFPGGCYASSDVKLANEAGLTVIGWDLASGDAFNPNTAAIVRNVLKNAKNGSIIVFHLSGGHYAPKTADALKMIIPELRKQGFEFKTVPELLKPLQK